MGSVSGLNVAAVRLMSGAGKAPADLASTSGGCGAVPRRTQPPTTATGGIVLLFSLETGELLAILPQFNLSGVRVGATTGVAVKHLARRGRVGGRCLRKRQDRARGS
jgi:ornithine cyclodeaminase/alanine dehydrogenase-like protein (mu-crystallin family)